MQLYQKILADDPMLVAAYLGLGRLQKNDPEARIALLERGLRMIPGQPQLTGILGQAYEHAGRIDDAIAVYEALIEDNPNSPAAINNLAALLLDYRTDEASFQRALRLVSDFENSQNPAFLDTLGWAYYRLGEHEQAIFFLERAASRASEFPCFVTTSGWPIFRRTTDMLHGENYMRQFHYRRLNLRVLTRRKRSLQGFRNRAKRSSSHANYIVG